MKVKKILAYVLIVLIFTMSFVFAEEGENGEVEGPGLFYDFYYEWDESWSYIPDSWSGTQCELEYSDNALLVNIHGKDPSFPIEIREEIELSEYPIIKVRIKNESITSETFEMYVIRDGESIAETNNFHYNIGKEHTEFQEFIIDATAVKGVNWWTGNLTALRFDAIRNAAEEGGESFYLEYIGFFKTEEDAEAFTPDRNQTPPPTLEPTDTPAPTPVPTEAPEKTATTAPKSDEKDGNGMTAGIIVAVVIILAAVVVAVMLIMRSRKNNEG